MERTSSGTTIAWRGTGRRSAARVADAGGQAAALRVTAWSGNGSASAVAAVAAGAGLRLVHNDPEEARAPLLQLPDDAHVVDETLGAGLRHIENAVGGFRQLQRVGVERAGRAVQQDHVGAVAQVEDQGARLRRAEELGWIGGNDTGGDQPHVVAALDRRRHLREGRRPRDQAGKAGARAALLRSVPESVDTLGVWEA